MRDEDLIISERLLSGVGMRLQTLKSSAGWQKLIFEIVFVFGFASHPLLRPQLAVLKLNRFGKRDFKSA